MAYRKVFSFYLSHGQIGRMLPMSVQDLKKMLTELVMAGESVSSLRTVAAAVSRLHTRAGFASPTESGGGLTKLLKPFRSRKARPERYALP